MLGDTEYLSRCVVCGEWIDFCQGHGEIGDPAGYAILKSHDSGDHSKCHPKECGEAPCRCESPEWVFGMMHVSVLDAKAVYNELREHGRTGPRCQRCGYRPYHPDVSFDPYA